MPRTTGPTPSRLGQMTSSLWRILTGPQALAFLPALTLGAYWAGGELALLSVALGVPLAFVSIGSGHLLLQRTEKSGKDTSIGGRTAPRASSKRTRPLI